MHCSSPAVQMQSSTPTGGESGVWGAEWRTCFCLYSEKERMRQREKVHPSMFFPPIPPHPNPGLLQCWLAGKRREEGRVQLIRDQWRSVYVLISDQEQWVGPAPPLPYTYPSPTTTTTTNNNIPTHFSPYQSSRTCRQRWPPLALHCQRMMQQRHRRWPPPCTEGGGVTGAK